MTNRKISDTSLFMGLFYPNSETLWIDLNRMLNKLPHWIYLTDEHTQIVLKTALKKHINKGEIVQSSEWGFRDNVFQYEKVIQNIKNRLDSFFTDTHKTLTLFIEMTWAVRTPPASIYLRNFEIELQKLTDSYPLSICCLYNESILLDEQLILAMQAHPHIFTSEGLKENPHYLPPSVFKKNTLRSQFNYWIGQIEPHRKPVEKEILVKDTVLQNGGFQEPIYHIDKTLYSKIAQSDEERWKIRCLGDLKVYRNNGEKLEWDTKGGATKKVKTLFAYLLFKGEKGASIEELADLLWSDILDMSQSTNRLYHTIRCLRLVLEGKDMDLRHSPFILHQNAHYYLTLPQDSWIDLPMFQELCFKGNEHFQHQNLEQSLICYQSAERLYQGDLLKDIPQKYTDNTEHDWCWSRRFWYRDMHHKLLYSTANIQRQLGNIPESLNACDKALAIEPYSESAHREKIISLKAANRLDAVHRQYRLYCESLKKFDMGEPSKEIKELYSKIIEKN
jgi:DNA-binding SARP family transcriptional activator